MTVSVDQVQANLMGLLSQLREGEEIVVVQGDEAVAKIVRPNVQRPKPQFGSCKGMLTIVSEDDEHLKDFEEYMP